MRPTYRALNKHLTVCGCDRQLFLCGLFVGLGLFLTFSSILVGVVTFSCFVVLGWFRVRDRILLRLLFNSGRFRNQYDPAVRQPFALAIYDHLHRR